MKCVLSASSDTEIIFTYRIHAHRVLDYDIDGGRGIQVHAYADNLNVVMLLPPPPFPQVYQHMLLMYLYAICTKSGIGKYISSSCIYVYAE